jgi:hypothetical protein
VALADDSPARRALRSALDAMPEGLATHDARAAAAMLAGG